MKPRFPKSQLDFVTQPKAATPPRPSRPWLDRERAGSETGIPVPAPVQ